MTSSRRPRTRLELIWSIPRVVGADAVGGTYYKAKLAPEEIVSAVPAWTIQRATQLHPTLDRTLGRFSPRPRTWRSSRSTWARSPTAWSVMSTRGRPGEPRTSVAPRCSASRNSCRPDVRRPAGARRWSSCLLSVRCGGSTPVTSCAPTTLVGGAPGSSGCTIRMGSKVGPSPALRCGRRQRSSA
jgi:hypothetical protein